MTDFLTCLLGVGIAALAYNLAMAQVVHSYKIKRRQVRTTNAQMELTHFLKNNNSQTE